MTENLTLSDFSDFYGFIMPKTQSDLRQAAEKTVLTYLTALGYDQKPWQLLMERGLTFYPFPPDVINPDDPAAEANCLGADSDNSDVSVINANFLAPMSEADWVAAFELVYDFTNMVVSLVTYKFGLQEKSPEIIKPVFMARMGKMLSILNELSHAPKIMNGLELAHNLQTIIYSLKDNRKTNGHRYLDIL